MFNSYCTPTPFSVTDVSIENDKKRIPTSNPAVFGPPTWAYLHISTAHLPEQLNPVVAQQVRNTLLALPLMVPCDACSLHSGNFMSSNKDHLESLKTGSDFFRFTVDLHNFVNQRLGKKQISYDEAALIWK